MYLIPLSCTLAILILFIILFMKPLILCRLNVYIAHVMLGFMVILWHAGDQSLPLELILPTLTAWGLLWLKHQSQWKVKAFRLFSIKLVRHFSHILLLCAASYYISYVPIGINVMFVWISLIGMSALYAFTCYVAYSSNFNQFSTQPPKFDLLLVLGAGIFTEEVTPMLKARLEAALALWKEHPDSDILVSGGQGADEPISEALAMQRYLILRGVPSSAIILENQSTSTYENILFSRNMLETHAQSFPSILCVTSQFHVLRVLRFAQKLALPMRGCGSVTPYHFLDMALIRDFLALMYQYRLLLTIYFGALFIFAVISMWFIPTT